MDKIKVEPQTPSIFPLLPVKTLHLEPNRFRAVEAADWWTLYYVEGGRAEISCTNRSHILSSFFGILLQPGQAHDLITFANASATVIQITFQAAGYEMLLLRNKRLEFDRRSRRLLREIVEEAECCHREINRDGAYTPASGHYIQLLCEQLMLQLKRAFFSQMKEAGGIRKAAESPSPWEQNLQRNRRYAESDDSQEHGGSQSDTANLQLFNKLADYLRERVYSSISLDELVSEFHFSKTHLSQTFKAHSGKTILTYYNSLKIEEAKRLIAETNMNFSQISNQLNFSSLHYFSRLFKKHTNLSPSEYQASVSG